MTDKGDYYDHLFKIVLVGDAGVGKTHLLSRYIKGYLPANKLPTVGVEFATKTISLRSGGTVKAQIWDTAGQERYKAITSAHYRRAVGALLVYDITKEASFKNIARWMQELKSNAEPDIVIMLVGNKFDLVETDPGSRRVERTAAERFAKEHDLMFEETSALSNHKVTAAFENLLQEISNQRQKESSSGPSTYPAGISIKRDVAERSGCCP